VEYQIQQGGASMKKRLIIALGAAVLLSGCNNGENMPPEGSEHSVTASVSESEAESRTTTITTGSKDLSDSGAERDMPEAVTENETEYPVSAGSGSPGPQSEQSQTGSDDTELNDDHKAQESETSAYAFGDYLERDND
jgi:hypothetical protein